jgi:hypothetical protein
LRRHEKESSYIKRFLGEPFLELFAEHEGLRSLLSMRKCAKELSEAYGAARQAEALLASLGMSEPTGKGAVLLDVCSGKGLAATLLSFLLPDAAVVMLDSNGAMELTHVTARPNLTFIQFDLFSRDAEATLGRLGDGVGVTVCIAIGTHLCGTLSPRLIDLAVRVPQIHGLVLCPCCLRGSLGYKITQAAKERNTDPYRLAVATLAALCQAELDSQASRPIETNVEDRIEDNAGRGVPMGEAQSSTTPLTTNMHPGGVIFPGVCTRTSFDTQVISPKNGYITAAMSAPDPQPPCPLAATTSGGE